MNSDHFLYSKRLAKLMSKKVDKEVLRNLEVFSEKLLIDLINRSSTLCKHKNKDVIEASEISFVSEKDFDYSFGIREINRSRPLPTDEHVEKMADIARQNR